MESKVSSDSAAVPYIVITEPSPLIQNTSVMSIAEKAGPITEATASPHPVKNGTVRPVQDGTAQSRPAASDAVARAVVKPEASHSSEEFKLAQECTECQVSIPEQQSQSVEEATTAGTSEADQDEFRTESSCGLIFTACLMRYERLWEILDNRCRLPMWLILMALPVSAGIMSSLYMFSCPAADTMPSALFSIAISLMAVLSIRVCIILHRLTCNESDFRHALQTLLLIATFVTIMFFVTESVIFWQMDWTSQPGDEKFCDPTFVNYSFWWNCIMWVVMVLLVVSPA